MNSTPFVCLIVESRLTISNKLLTQSQAKEGREAGGC